MSNVVRVVFATTAIIIAASVAVDAQQQAPGPRNAWPCGGRLDPSYFRVAEGSGGQLWLLAPDEIADSAPVLLAITSHPQTIFRLAGSITPGLSDFQIPIDSSVESVVFSASVQCLEAAYVLRPNGERASGDDVTDFSSFRAQRMVIVRRPQPGVWTVRVAGRGGVNEALGKLALSDVDTSSASLSRLTPNPSGFRVMISGKDADGFVVQRMYAPLFTPLR
jgi:hypothetical protein